MFDVAERVYHKGVGGDETALAVHFDPLEMRKKIVVGDGSEGTYSAGKGLIH